MVSGKPSEPLTIPVTRQRDVCPEALTDNNGDEKSNQSAITILLALVFVLCVVIAGGIGVMYVLLRNAKATAPSCKQTEENDATAPELGINLSTIQLEETAAATGVDGAEAQARDNAADQYANCDQVGRNLYEPLRR